MGELTRQSSRPVMPGQVLIHEKQRHDGALVYEVWSVKGVRMLKSGDAKVTLLMATCSLTGEATATFPDGVVADPFRIVELSQGDLELVWKGRSDG